ncbi:MAG: hypothetical protein LIO75_04275 [Lachnospiraceae bacterium]|nr:hypothetical protein [Lachnospiraceae bacterium]
MICMILPLSLAGCVSNEVESNAFPLAIGIAAEQDGGFHMYVAYPDLEDPDAAEDALSKDAYWDESLENLTEGTELMSKVSSRNVDMNHLKVLILDSRMLDGGTNADCLIQYFREEKDIAWNAYVLLADAEMEDLFSDEVQINACLGIYLEDLIEGWEDIKSGSLVTVGSLVSQYYNENETLLVPVAGIEESQPVVENFAAVSGLRVTGEQSMEEVFASHDSLILFEG